MDSKQWSIERAGQWYNSFKCWLVGCNFIPSIAINQIEMWSTESYNPAIIEREVSLARSLGFNVLRVYLHDLLWDHRHDNREFIKNIDNFLEIITKYSMKVIFVLFDDCHRNNPQIDKPLLPVKCVHNSGWFQSPGSSIVMDIHQITSKAFVHDSIIRLKGYVQGILSHYRDDDRILMWDLYNEPGQNGLGNVSNELLKLTWIWAREINPSQPLTSCLDGSIGDSNIVLNYTLSDIVTFHWYNGEGLELRIMKLIAKSCGRPIMCTEYMARGDLID